MNYMELNMFMLKYLYVYTINYIKWYKKLISIISFLFQTNTSQYYHNTFPLPFLSIESYEYYKHSIKTLKIN